MDSRCEKHRCGNKAPWAHTMSSMGTHHGKVYKQLTFDGGVGPEAAPSAISRTAASLSTKEIVAKPSTKPRQSSKPRS
jgi:hypothetical protein